MLVRNSKINSIKLSNRKLIKNKNDNDLLKIKKKLHFHVNKTYRKIYVLVVKNFIAFPLLILRKS